MDYSRLAQTYGALLVGGFIAASLSGILTLQCFLYMKLFPLDELRVKVIVGVVWFLDQSHSIMVCASIWRYVISGFGDYDEMDVISHYLALTVLLTGTLTFIVHCFFAYRIHRLSEDDWRLTSIILILAVCRISSATVSTAEMIHMRTFQAFMESFRWLFTLGLGLSCAEDIIIASSLVYSLHRGRRKSSSLDRLLVSVILYTIETNSLTVAWTIVCMICWLAMPNNLVFMGFHFFICKLYANSLLATLNTRKHLGCQRRRGTEVSLSTARYATSTEPPLTTKIYIEQTVQYSSERASEEDQASSIPPPFSARVTA